MNTRTSLSFFGALAIGGAVAFAGGNAFAQTAPMTVVTLTQTQTMHTHISAKDHVGKDVFTQQGTEIGTIKNMVQGSSPEVYAVVMLGGPVMSNTERDVVIPAAQLSFSQGRAIMTVEQSKALTRSSLAAGGWCLHTPATCYYSLLACSARRQMPFRHGWGDATI